MKALAMVLVMLLVPVAANAFDPCLGMRDLEQQLLKSSAEKAPDGSDSVAWKAAHSALAAKGQAVHTRRMSCEAAAAKAPHH
jgi:hypothetical protein